MHSAFENEFSSQVGTKTFSNSLNSLTLTDCSAVEIVVLHLRAQGLGEGDDQLPTLSCGAWLTFTFTQCNDAKLM